MTFAIQLRAYRRRFPRFPKPLCPTPIASTRGTNFLVPFGRPQSQLQRGLQSPNWTTVPVAFALRLHTTSNKMAAVQTVPIYESHGDVRSHWTKVMASCPVSSLAEGDQKLLKNAQPGDLAIQTSETIFHVQGGGQPSDTGTMTISPEAPDDTPVVLDVLAVRRGGSGAILHHCRMTNATGSAVAATIGVAVEQKVDGDKRDLFSRVHTAGHILGMAVRQLASKLPNDVQEAKGQHYPDDAFVQFQGAIGQEMKTSIQQGIDALIAQDLPVRVSVLDHDKMVERKIFVPDGFGYFDAEGTRVMEIDGLGGYPCSGTHCSSTAKLEKVVVTKMTTRKGATKIYYETK